MSKWDLNPEIERQIVAFYLAPNTLKDTSHQFGLSCKQAVKYILAKHDTPLHSKEVTLRLLEEKSKQAIVEKYGVDNAFKTKSAKAKIKNANEKLNGRRQEIIGYYLTPKTLSETAEHFGCSRTPILRILKETHTPLHEKELTNKIRLENATATNLQKYGVKCISQNEKVSQKIKQTNLKKYGAETPLKSADVKNKIKQTNLQRYGCENVFSSKEIQAKANQTTKAKYGVEWYQQTKEARQKAKKRYIIKKDWLISKSRKSRKKKYVIDDLTFDSLPELAFFICALEDGKEIAREPKKLLFFYEGEEHAYFPDFEVNGQLIEIKGDNFVNADGTWKNPFDERKNALWEVKRQCALNHHVKILYSAEYAAYVERFLSAHDINDFLTNKQKT